MGVCQQVGHCVTHCACTIIQELCAQQALCSAVCVCAHRYRSTVCTHIKALCNTSCTTDTRAVHAATHGQCAHPAHGLQQLRALWCAAPTLTSPGSACKRPGVEHQGYLCSSRRLMSPDHQQQQQRHNHSVARGAHGNGGTQLSLTPLPAAPLHRSPVYGGCTSCKCAAHLRPKLFCCNICTSPSALLPACPSPAPSDKTTMFPSKFNSPSPELNQSPSVLQCNHFPFPHARYPGGAVTDSSFKQRLQILCTQNSANITLQSALH